MPVNLHVKYSRSFFTNYVDHQFIGIKIEFIFNKMAKAIIRQ